MYKPEEFLIIEASKDVKHKVKNKFNHENNPMDYIEYNRIRAWLGSSFHHFNYDTYHWIEADKYYRSIKHIFEERNAM